VKCICGYFKHHGMPNYGAGDLGDLAHRARQNLCSVHRRTALVRAFWQQIDLY
jgi:hypothetical protein